MDLLGEAAELGVLQFSDMLGNKLTLNLTTQTADRTVSIPTAGSDDRLIFTDHLDTISGKTFTDTSVFGIATSNVHFLNVTENVKTFMDAQKVTLGIGGTKATVMGDISAYEWQYLHGVTSSIATQFQVNLAAHTSIASRLAALEHNPSSNFNVIMMSQATLTDTVGSKFTVVHYSHNGSGGLTLARTPKLDAMYEIRNTSNSLLAISTGSININHSTSALELPGGQSVWLRYIPLEGWILISSNELNIQPWGDTITTSNTTNTDDAAQISRFVISTGSNPVSWTLPATPDPRTTRWFDCTSTPLTIEGNGNTIDGQSSLVLQPSGWAVLRVLTDNSNPPVWVTMSHAISGGSNTNAPDTNSTGITTSSVKVTNAGDYTDVSTTTWTFLEFTDSSVTRCFLKATPVDGNLVQILNSDLNHILTVEGNAFNIGGQSSVTIEEGSFKWLRFLGGQWHDMEAQIQNADNALPMQVALDSQVTENQVVELLTAEQAAAKAPGFTQLQLVHNTDTQIGVEAFTSLNRDTAIYVVAKYHDSLPRLCLTVVQTIGADVLVKCQVDDFYTYDTTQYFPPRICALSDSTFVVVWKGYYSLHFLVQYWIYNRATSSCTRGSIYDATGDGNWLTTSVCKLSASKILLALDSATTGGVLGFIVGTINLTTYEITFGSMQTVTHGIAYHQQPALLSQTETSAIVVWSEAYPVQCAFAAELTIDTTTVTMGAIAQIADTSLTEGFFHQLLQLPSPGMFLVAQVKGASGTPLSVCLLADHQITAQPVVSNSPSQEQYFGMCRIGAYVATVANPGGRMDLRFWQIQANTMTLLSIQHFPTDNPVSVYYAALLPIIIPLTNFTCMLSYYSPYKYYRTAEIHVLPASIQPSFGGVGQLENKSSPYQYLIPSLNQYGQSAVNYVFFSNNNQCLYVGKNRVLIIFTGTDYYSTKLAMFEFAGVMIRQVSPTYSVLPSPVTLATLLADPLDPLSYFFVGVPYDNQKHVMINQVKLDSDRNIVSIGPVASGFNTSTPAGDQFGFGSFASASITAYSFVAQGYSGSTTAQRINGVFDFWVNNQNPSNWTPPQVTTSDITGCTIDDTKSLRFMGYSSDFNVWKPGSLLVIDTATGLPLYGPLLEGRLVGVAKSSGLSGDTVQVSFGPTVGGFTGLIPGKKYYATPGGISATTIDGKLYVGVAISETQIMLNRNMSDASQFQ